MKLTILVTGAAGLVGGYIFHELKKTASFNVISGGRELIPDLADLDSVKTLENLGHIDIIVHCAARIPSGNLSMEDVAAINRKIDDNIFYFCKKSRVKVVFVSSMGVYAQYGQDGIIDEIMPVLPLTGSSDYFKEKVNSEKLFMELDSAITFRISSPYGVNQKNKNVLKIFAEKIKQNKNICYYGTGKRTQDFIHGKDIANACMRAIQQNASGIFNIVSGNPISMKELAILFAKIAPNYIGTIYSKNIDDPQEQFRANFSNAKSKNILGWNPIIPLSEGIRELL